MKLKRSQNKHDISEKNLDKSPPEAKNPVMKKKSAALQGDNSKWKLLIVDDEPDIHEITRIALKGFKLGGKKLEFQSSYSAKEAREILAKEQDFSMAIIDVVMESDEAGLELVRYIREDIGLSHIRLIVRTGQPGKAPEKFVIQNYDIDDYVEKTDLTLLKMYTMTRSMIKSYRDILTIEKSKELLEQKVQERTRELYEANELLKQENEAKKVLIEELKDANNEIKTLSGIIPICMHCKEIRDDKGFWNRLELYIESHSKAKFSHSVCEKCLDEHYPEEDED